MKGLRLVGLVIGLGFFGLYGYFAFKGPVNYADSDDLTMAAYFGGLAHPPGYPYLVSLLYPWLHGFQGPQVALAANRFNSGISALNVGLVMGLSYTIGTRFGKRGRKRWLAAAGLSAVGFGLWQTTWLNARVLEVFPLAQSFCLLAWWSLVEAVTRMDKQRWYGLGAGMFGGAALFYHPLTVTLILPSWIFGWQVTRAKRLSQKPWVIRALIGLGLMFGLSFSLYGIWPRNEADYSWPVEPSVSGVLKFYRRLSYTSQGSAIELDVNKFDGRQLTQSAVVWAKGWMQESHGLGLGLAILGLFSLFKRERRVFWWLGVSFGLAGLAVALYLRFPTWPAANEVAYWWGLALRWRMQYAAALPLVLMTSWGWDQLLRLKQNWLGWGLVAGLMMSGWSGWRLNQSHLSQPEVMAGQAQAVLNSLPLNSHLLVDGDLIFALLYQQLVLGLRPDIQVRPLRFELTALPPNQIKLPFAKLTTETEALERIMSVWSDLNQPIFLYDPSAALLSFLGVEGNPFYAAPYGYTLAIGRTMPEPLTKFGYQTPAVVSQDRLHPWWQGFRAQQAEILAQLAYYWARLGYPAAAEQLRQQALTLAPTTATGTALTESLAIANWAYQAHNTYAAYTPPSLTQYLDQLQLSQESQIEADRFWLSRAILLAPENEALKRLMP